MQIERGASNTFALLGRPILSPSYWLLWFRDPERNASVYCIATASNTTGGMLTLTFTETNSPTALNGQVKLSPRGNWELKVYEQTSATNLNPANAGRLVKTIGILVTGTEAADTGWSGTACPPGGGDCDPTTVNGTESDVRDISVRRGGVEVGTLAPSTGIHTVPECDPCPPCLPSTVTLAGVEIVNEADPCGVDVALDCADLVDAVVVEGAGTDAANGLYIRDGINDGLPAYAKQGGTSFDRLQFLGTWAIYYEEGSYYQGDEDERHPFPWEEPNWYTTDGVAPVPTVRQATIGDICRTPCDPVTIEDQDGTPIDSVPSGGTYSVIVVSAIDGGLSNTTYTNSIIQP